MTPYQDYSDGEIDDLIECGEFRDARGTFQDAISSLAAALKAERAKPKVWDGAPEDTEAVYLYWGINGTSNVMPGPKYTRKLTKSRARIIAEKYAQRPQRDENTMIDILEAAINEALEE